MSSTPGEANRIAVLLPSVRDAERTAQVLFEAGVESVICRDLAAVCREIRQGAVGVLTTEELLSLDSGGALLETLREQPAWSTIAVVVITREGAGASFSRRSDALTGLIVVERPVRTHSLVSVVLSVVRARRGQYQVRDAILLRDRHAQELLAQDELLRSQAIQLRDADRRKDDFLATLAHELRNPLAPIRTGLDLLRKGAEPAMVERTLGVMSRQLSHLVRLVDDLLDVSRITRGKLELRPEPVTLAAVVGAAVEASRPFVDRAGHTLAVTLPETPVELDADLTRLSQVIGNLLNNAAKYTPAGGHIHLDARVERRDVLIAVRDDGVGIPADHIDAVFDMFSQVSSELERTQGGLGIGLALVRLLVEMHGGTVTAESAGAGRGSTFTVRLPLASRADAAVPAPRAEEAPSRRRRVLIVDDNQDAADMLGMLLEGAGYETTVVYGSAEALEVAGKKPLDFAILDIGLPGMNGYDVARALRRRPDVARLGLVALTGWGSREDKDAAMQAGFDVHLTKPVDAGSLRTALGEMERLLQPDA